MRVQIASVRYTSCRVTSQQGAAIISVLLVVALSAILVSNMLWRQQVQVRRIENQRLLMQAQWVARGALDWARFVLRAETDTSAGFTYLGGVWSVPIEKTRLSDFLGQINNADTEQGITTYLQGRIEDAQAKFNLRNLVSSVSPGTFRLNVEQIQIFQRLLQLLGLNSSLAKNVAVQLRAGLEQLTAPLQIPSTVNDTTTQSAAVQYQNFVKDIATSGIPFLNNPNFKDSNNNRISAPLQMTSVNSLLDVPGFTRDIVDKLRPFVILLPTVTPININTASGEVIASVILGMTLSSAQTFVTRRQNAFFHNVSEARFALRGAGAPQISSDTDAFDVKTSYFLVHGHVQHERAELDRTALIWCDSFTHTTRIVWIRDQF